MQFSAILFLLSFYLTCQSKQEVKSDISPSVQEQKLFCGADRTDVWLPMIEGKRVALVVNQTSIINQTHLVDSLLSLRINVVKIFAPEHGFRGEADAGAHVSNETDTRTGLPILSIYGKNKKPSAANLSDVDVILFDIQDVGARFYTYISSLHYVMEAAAESGIPVIVLDRPNPNAHYVDGPVLKPEFKSFVGMHPVPVVYGMTIGEYAKMINGEGWLGNGIKCELTVIPMVGYNHQMKYSLPVKPSPNLPNYQSVLLYPSLCFFEGTVMSVGRGTDDQFQVLGHPSIQSDFSFTPQPNVGASVPVLNGKKCFGKDFTKIPIDEIFDQKRIDLSDLIKYYHEINHSGAEYFLKNLFFDKLAGTDELRKQIIAGSSEEEIRQSWKDDLQSFLKVRNNYLLYKD